MSALAFASSIPITGTVVYGNATTYGDFNISGPGLALFQALPQGPSTIGSCVIGTVCDFSFGPNMGPFCGYCTGSDDGTLGSKNAQYFYGFLAFTGSALYKGGETLTVPLALSGSIIGYELVNCEPTGYDCQRGPEVFNLLFNGTATGVFQFNDIGLMTGVQASLKGTATPVPEPISLTLVATGMAGILLRKRFS
jgi:hypothetical protein